MPDKRRAVGCEINDKAHILNEIRGLMIHGLLDELRESSYFKVRYSKILELSFTCSSSWISQRSRTWKMINLYWREIWQMKEMIDFVRSCGLKIEIRYIHIYIWPSSSSLHFVPFEVSPTRFRLSSPYSGGRLLPYFICLSVSLSRTRFRIS